jgi:diguanylate cyclase (GGDEF)-like protein
LDARHSISIAVLTECQDDVALINSALRDAGHAAHCHWVDQPREVGATLDREPIELLIINCDRFAEPIRQVIKLKDTFNPELPVLAMKERVDEASIEAAMGEGACDLVSIGNRQRLTAVVSRELRAFRLEQALNSTIRSTSEYKKQLKHYMQASPDAIGLIEEGIVTDVNDAWLTLFRAAANDEVTGLPLMDNFETGSHAAVKGALVAASAGKWDPAESLIAQSKIARDGNSSVHLKLQRFVFDNGPCVQVRITVPVEERAEPTKLVHDALQRDPATLFFHRSQFVEQLEKRLQKKPGSGLHLLAYIRVDHFSDICNRVGYLNSDEVLAQFADAVRKRLHPRDVAGRFEGTALLVLLERGSTRDADSWGKQLCQLVSDSTFDVGDASTQLTCTIGICPANDIYGSLEEYVAATIAACERGREDGGNTVCLTEEASESTKLQEFDAIWVRHLKAALMEDRFRLATLPIAGLRSDGLQMYDLLVRMLDEQGKSVLPSEFLPAARRNNMMKNIDRWMIKAAIRFCGESDVDRVFVRLSEQSIQDATTADWIRNEFQKHRFDAARIVMQVPEREAASRIKQTKTVVSNLRKLGAGFALEHYGLDRERTQILDMLRPDYIKIDGELMHSLMTDTDLQMSVKNIVRNASERGIKTIAERVENANAMAVLFQLGLDYMQGHYLHEPEVVLEDEETGSHTTLAELSAISAG